MQNPSPSQPTLYHTALAHFSEHQIHRCARTWQYLSLLMLALCWLAPGKSHAQGSCYSWTSISSGFPSCAGGDPKSLTVGRDGTLYAAFQECADGRVSVMKYSGGIWQYIGGAGSASDGVGTWPSVAVDSNSVPYVAFRDYANSSTLNVKKFDGTSWQRMANPQYLSANSISYIHLQFDHNSRLVVTYKDSAWGSNNVNSWWYESTYNNWSVLYSGPIAFGVDNPDLQFTSLDSAYLVFRSINSPRGPLRMMRQRNTNWTSVLDTVTTTNALYPSFAFDNRDSLFVAYIDSATGVPKVIKYNTGGAYFTPVRWTEIGTLTGGRCSNTSLIFDNNNQPILFYADSAANNTKAVRYNGATWNIVGVFPITDAVTGRFTVTKDNAGTIYVAYADYTNDGKPEIKKLEQPVAGNPLICIGDIRTYTSSIAGGVWNSSNTTVATINTSTGMLTALASGTSVVSYTTGACTTAITVTVSPNITGNTGPDLVDINGTATLSNAADNGRWRTSNINVARVGAVSGLIYGEGAGSAIISYTTLAGCIATTQVTVHVPCFSWTSPIGGLPTFSCSTGGPSTAVDNSGNIYWAFTETCTSNKVSVMKYNGSTWDYLGGSGGVTGTANSVSPRIALSPGGTPYVALSDNPLGGGNSKLAVKKYNGSSWEYVGSSTITAGVPQSMDIAFNSSGVPYVVVSDGATNGLCYVYKLVGSSWVQVGGTVGTSRSDYTEIEISASGVPYVAYRNFSAGGTYGFYFDGTNWVQLGTGPAGVLQMIDMRMALDQNNNMYVAYLSYNENNRPYVVKYNGSSWAALPAIPKATNSWAAVALTVDNNNNPIFAGNDLVETKPKALKFDGTSWSLVGNVPYLDTSSNNNYLNADGSGVVYISYVDWRNGFHPGIKKIYQNNITGNAVICAGNTATFSDPTPGGTWTSDNISVATVNAATGVVTGTGGGITQINYVTGDYCKVSKTITVNALPVITGNTHICFDLTTTLSSSLTGGTWSSSNDVIAATMPTGEVWGNSVGTAAITYTATTGCRSSVIVTIHVNPVPVSGASSVCSGSTITLTDATHAGSWTSSDPATATIDPSSGVVTGVNAGGVTITYAPNAYCMVTKPITVNPLPPAIGGSDHVCAGLSTTLSNTVTGGSWGTSNSSIAAIDAAGVVTGVNNGSAVITYTRPATGCKITAGMTVNTFPAAISGPSAICNGNTGTFTDATTGGVWSSANAVAAISASGVVTALSSGIATISYSTNPYCNVAKIITLNPLPAAITGPGSVCEGLTITLSSATTDGAWSSSNTGIASVDAAGIVSGGTTGTATITYTLPTGCLQTVVITVNPLPAAISGTGNICAGNTATLTNTMTGGSWSSSAAAIVSIDAASGIATSSYTAGSTTITYTSDKGCIVTAFESNSIGSIVGSNSICTGLTTTLASTTSGGTWSSSAAAVATVGTTGIVSALTGGMAVITYSAAGCYRTQAMAITTTPAPIAGSGTVCVGSTITLSDASLGGTWDCINPALLNLATLPSGDVVINAVATGNAIITYSLSGICKITAPLTVNSLPATITGQQKACPGTSATLTCATAGGAWSTPNTDIAGIDAGTGIATGLSSGTALISYTLPTTCARTAVLTINPTPGPINGNLSTCTGGTTALSDATPTGISWTSSNTGIATINSTGGTVTGTGTGIVTITYTVATGCFTTADVTVNPLPAAISGTLKVCSGLTTTLANTSTGGTWSSSNTAVATTDMSGIVTGAAAGTTTITYTLGSGCIKTVVVTVTSVPAAIAGTLGICQGATTTLADAGGGVWSSDNTTVATVNSVSGVTSGLTAGTANISYTVGSGCFATTVITINPMPAAITGSLSICPGSSATLYNASSGGTWTVNNPAYATINTTSGVISGIASGNTAVTYTLSTGCFKIATAVINPAPAAIVGASAITVGNTATLTDASTGGTWSSVASVISVGSSTGVVTGLSSGTAMVTYTVPTGCATTTVMTINTTPGVISGSPKACIGGTTTLSSGAPGGTWSSSNTVVATVDASSGVVTALTSGTSAITYTIAPGNYTTTIVTISVQPAAITGSLALCTGSLNTLYNATTGGNSWVSSNPSVVNVGVLSGIITGLTTGTSSITYTLNSGCYSTAVVTVNPIPTAIGGTLKVCVGAATTLTDTDPLGTWTSGTPLVASISSAGVAAGLASGTSRITYTLPTGCITTAILTVNTAPSSITGTPVACTGTATTLASTGGGTWLSDNTATATISGSGVATGGTPGTANITFTATNTCTATVVVTVNPLPSASTGTASICLGSSTTLSNALPGGTWQSSNPAIAVVGSATGIVSTLSSTGTANITYSFSSVGCRTVTQVTINVLPGAISGTTTVCKGAAVTLSSTTGGVWSSTNSAVGTVGSISTVSGRVVGIAAGVTTISYKIGATGCARAVVITVNPTPDAGTITSTGGFNINTVTPPTSITLSSTGDAGGAWQSSATAKATVGAATGIVNAVAAGTTTISYTVTLGSCTAVATHAVTVTAARAAGYTATAFTATELRLFPNPNSGIFTIKGALATAEDQEIAIEVVDMAGQVVYSTKAIAMQGDVTTAITLSNTLPNGMYMLNVRTATDNSAFHFVIAR